MITLFSPAKLNLFFSVLRKREDGFHEIASLYQAIDLCDLISFSTASKDAFISSDPRLPLDSSNLIIKARDLFRKKTGLTTPLSISLTKNIPKEAGLGGGSSNAATTLYALNQLLGAPLKEKELIQLGSQLGSDVPFFFSKGCCYCTGKGEIFKEITLPFDFKAELYKPSFGLSTPEVYKNFSLFNQEKDPLKLLESFEKGRPVYQNDLESSAFVLSPKLKEIKGALLESFDRVVMTGSGSALVCLGDKDSRWQTRTVKALARYGEWYTKSDS